MFGRLDGFKADSWSLGLVIFNMYEERNHFDKAGKYDASTLVLNFTQKSPPLA